MQKFRVPINSFQFGEVSESTKSRIDSPIYAASAQRLENLVVRAEGGASKRAGLKNIYDFGITKSSSKRMQHRLLPFIFSDDERYIISVENAKVRAFRIVSETSVVLVSTLTADTASAALPFDDDYLHEYTYAQSGDVMFICHPLFMPRMLTRTGLTSFEIASYSFDNRSDDKETYQPYSTFHPTDMTLDPSAVSGTGITLTTSAAYWDITGDAAGGVYPNSTHVGVKVRYGYEEILITSVVSATVANGNVVDTLIQKLTVLNPFRTISGSTTVEVTMLDHGFEGSESITFSDASAVGNIATSNLNGARTVTGIIDDNTFTFTAGGSANADADGGGFVKISSHAPSRNWDEQSFSAKRGYPAAVTLHENRLVFAGTTTEPDTLWFSKSSQFFNFDVGDGEDNSSINLIAATGDVNEIRYLVSDRDLQVFTASAELYVPTFLNQAITPTNAQIRKQTPFGCEFVQPTPLDGATVFVQKGSKVVREYLYTDSEDAYTSTAVSTIASHLIIDFKDIAVCNGAFEEAESYSVYVSTNGDCSVFGSNRAEKRAGWSRFTTQGSFESVVAIDDRLFASVWFDDTNLRLCEFKTDLNLDNAKSYSLSSNAVSVSSDFANSTVVHVLGTTSAGLTDYLGTHTVSGGNVSLTQYNTTYATAEIGYSFPVTLTTNPIDASVKNGPVTGEPRGVATVVVDLVNTKSASVNAINLISDSSVTGKKEFRLLGYSRDPQITISQSEPLSFQVNGLTAELIV